MALVTTDTFTVYIQLTYGMDSMNILAELEWDKN